MLITLGQGNIRRYLPPEVLLHLGMVLIFFICESSIGTGNRAQSAKSGKESVPGPGQYQMTITVNKQAYNPL